MNSARIAPYGTWSSPVTSELIVGETIGLGDIVLSGPYTYWSESRPTEGGRSAIVRCDPSAQVEDVIPVEYNAQSRVHEYGGGAFTVHGDTVYFVNLQDQGIYRQQPGGLPAAVWVEEGLRFADLVMDAQHHRLLAVCEDHRGDGEPVNSLVAIDLTSQTGRLRILASGADFYAAPCPSPDARQLAWLCWQHPDMPWDASELWLAELAADGSPQAARRLAGDGEEAIFQPQWGPDGSLYFVSDRNSGWWNLYRWRDDKITALPSLDAETGSPMWVFQQSTYGFTAAGELICACNRQGLWQLGKYDRSHRFHKLDTPYSAIAGIRCAGERVVFQAGSASEDTAIVEYYPASGERRVLRRASRNPLDPGYISVAEPISFASSGGRTAHAFFYPPRNRDFQAPQGEKPPLLVKGHGGPTSASTATLNLGIQYWTSRGFAVLDVNYGGSTGFGREYRQQLNGQWGVVDVDDCVAAAEYVIAQGRADGERTAIRGSSAGGYTTLAALAFRDTFKAGASYYGIGELESLAEDTHKFESRYLDRLIGPYPEQRDLYRQRSPLYHLDGLSAPVIFFQGLQDKVVPPNQAERMVDALRRKGVAVAYVAFADERHGFRKAANIKRSLEAELYFYGRIFGFSPAGPVVELVIENF